MGKYVRETSAAKALSAWIVLNRKGEEVATVNAFHGQGRCLVNIFDRAAGFQSSAAGGYGSDRLTSALTGLTVDGHTLTDHCSRQGAPKPPKGRKTFPRDYTPPKGYTLANFADGARRDHDGSKRYPGLADDEAGYSDCYRIEGLNYLKAIGYRVLQAI